METVEEPQKKIFKARKTMRTSDRQQLEVVHKAKEEFLQKQGQGVVEESGTTGAPSPAPTPPPTPSTPLVNGKHNSNENGDLEQPDSPVADKATSSPKSLSEDIQESEEMEELEPTSSGNVNQKETVESELYEDISEPSPYSESPQDARVSQSLPAKVVQEQPEEEKTTENVREVEDTNSTTIKTIEDKGNAGKLADDGSPAENKEASLESKVPEVKSVSPTPAPSPIVLLMPLEVEHRDKSPTQLEDIGDLAISSSVEGNAEDISDSLVKNKLNERNVDGETEEKASSVDRLEAGSPGPSVSTTAMETETGDSEEIIPILEKLAPSSSAPLSPSSPPSEDVLSPAQSPSRQDSSDLVPREGFLVLSDEDEGEKDRMDCEEVQKDTVQSTATLPEETGSANVAEVETVEEPKTSSNLELEAEPETEVLEMSTQRKRSCSDDVEVVSEPKRRRFLEGNYEAELELKITAARADVHQKLEKIVQRILEEKIRALQWSVFDKTLEELKSRVEKIDCSKRHEAVLTGLQAKISRLSKKFGAANQAQDEARKQQEISASQADLSSGAATTTYRRNVHTVRKMLETKRNDTPVQQPATVISASQGGSQTTNVQIKAVAPSTVAVTGTASIVGTSQPIVATAGTASNGGVSTTVTQSGGQAIPLQSMPVIFHVPVAVTSQPQIVQAPQGTIMTTQAQGMELVPVSSSATSISLPGGSTANKSMLSTPPRVMQTVPASSNPTVSSPGSQTVSQVSVTRTPLSTSVTYGTTTTTRTLVQPKSQASTAPASQSSTETAAVGVASKTDNQTANRSAESSSGKSTAQGTRVVGNGPVIDLTEDDDDVQVTGVKRAPVQVTQPAQSNVHTPSARSVQSTQLPNPSPSTPTVATTPTTAPAVTTPPTPVLQTTTMHVLPTTQTTVNVMQRTTPQQAVAVTTRTPTQSQVQRTPVSSQVVYTTAPGSSRVVASQQTSAVARQGSPQTSANATRSNAQMTTYTANGPQLTIHHRAGQETSRPVHPAPLPEAPVPPRLPPEAASTSAPQKPQLKLARVQSQNGIVLSWCVAEVDRTCAAVDSYHLYAYHEDPNASSASQWKKIGEVKALPLPMACTLTQFVSGSKYYFAVRAKDIYGRFGPFCDPQSTDVIATQNS